MDRLGAGRSGRRHRLCHRRICHRFRRLDGNCGGVCLITPPVGLNCFVVNGVRPDISLSTIFRGITLFFVADVITIGVLLAFPGIIIWLPALLR